MAKPAFVDEKLLLKEIWEQFFFEYKSFLADWVEDRLEIFNQKSHYGQTEFNKFNFVISKDEGGDDILLQDTATFPVYAEFKREELISSRNPKRLTILLSILPQASKRIWRLSIVGGPAAKLSEDDELRMFLVNHGIKLTPKMSKGYIFVNPTPKEFNFENILIE